MCNRFRMISDWSNLPRFLDAGPRLNFEFSASVAPTDLAPVVMAQADAPPRTIMARFGINRTDRDGKPLKPLLNARTDGLRRGNFRTLLQGQRCIIPAGGFYEWREEEGGKQPYLFSRADGAPLLLAGIWQESEYKGDKRPAFAILTDEPNALIAPYHDRMPYALSDDTAASWLDLAQPGPLDAARLLNLDAFAVRPMNRAVNSSKQKDLALIDAAAA